MREIGTCEVLAEIDEERLDRILADIPEDTEILGAPREGLVLMTVREGLGSRFHPGEVLASSCRVQFRGMDGWAVVIGGDVRRALAAAALDAMGRVLPEPPELSRMLDLVEAGREAIVGKRSLEASLSASTKVEFDLLAEA
ncbi:MAG TPA: phosphonate C-P lyase system protein PhnG [Fibrobacteria bacterium]|nr:phosphonate C-P lyase system protein PhnG [Fibrobacteria bacterium]